jgi:hypothetical protein
MAGCDFSGVQLEKNFGYLLQQCIGKNYFDQDCMAEYPSSSETKLRSGRRLLWFDDRGAKGGRYINCRAILELDDDIVVRVTGVGPRCAFGPMKP